MKKVILITSTFTNERKGGVPSFVENRALYLSKRLNVIVYGLGESYNLKNIEFKSIGKSTGFKYFFLLSWFKLFLLCLRNRDSIIEIHNIPVSFPIFFIFNCRYFFHGPSRLEAKAENKSLFNQRLSYYIEKWSLELSNKVFVVSKYNKKVLINEHKLKRRRICLMLPKYKFKSVFSEEIKLSNENLTFVIIRRLVKRTGVVPFVELFIKMQESNIIQSNCKLIIAGAGPEKEKLMDIIEKSDFKHNINYLGLISEEEKVSLYKMADYNVVPTIELEGFGLVIIEAGICGCMSIVSNVDAMPEVIGYLSNQGIIYNLEESSPLRIFGGLKKNNYDKNELQKITKKKFYFN